MLRKIPSVLRRGVRYRKNRPCGDESVEKGREPTQMGWYAHAASLLVGDSVLDVGCGLGHGLAILAGQARVVLGIDLDERLVAEGQPNIRVIPIENIPDKSFDTVVCIDVLEHVDEDRAFVAQLARVARKRLYVSTPNFAVGANAWPYHVREYTPRELETLFRPFGTVSLFGGSSEGEVREPIRRRGLYFLLCDLYSYHLLIWIGRVLRRLLSMRVWHHSAIVVDLEGE